MTVADKLRIVWERIEAEDDDSEWLWKVYYQLLRELRR